VPIVMKSGSLNFLEPSGPVQVCTEIALPYDFMYKYWSLFSDFRENWFLSTDSQKCSNIKFNENPSSGSRVVPGGRTDRQTDRQCQN
jgi:hypothetical protein